MNGKDRGTVPTGASGWLEGWRRVQIYEHLHSWRRFIPILPKMAASGLQIQRYKSGHQFSPPDTWQAPPLTVCHILTYLKTDSYLKQPLPINAYLSSLLWMTEQKGAFSYKVGLDPTYLILRCLNLTPLPPPQTSRKWTPLSADLPTCL